MAHDRYFDYAASAPPFPEALQRFEEISLRFHANPSSTHEEGRKAREALENARQDFLSRAGIDDAALVLTSGGTEANNLAIRSVMESRPDGRLLLAADAHPSAWFARDLYAGRTDILETGPDGRLSPEKLEARLSRKTVLVSLLHANNETGVVHDMAALGAACARKGAALHVDGVQALGRLPGRLSEIPFAFYTFSAHKFGGPRGMGGLIARAAPPGAQLRGGGQEKGVRGGTENVAGLAAALVALERSLDALPGEVPRLRRLAARLRDELAANVPGLLVNSAPEAGLPGLLSVSFPGRIGENLVADLSLRGFAVSAGSACGSGRMEPSRPVLAMGRTREQALGTVRISMGRHTTEESAAALAAALKEAVAR